MYKNYKHYHFILTKTERKANNLLYFIVIEINKLEEKKNISQREVTEMKKKER